MTARQHLLLISVLTIIVISVVPYIGLPEVDQATSTTILSELRLPRIILAFCVGAGLALCGLVFQALFHNPLATPFTLGVASGAALGAASSLFLGINAVVLGISATTFMAFLGALLTIFFVYHISRLGSGYSVYRLLLTGVALNFFFSSLILFIQYLNDMTDSYRLVSWLMGHLAIVGYDAVIQLSPFVIVTLLVIILLAKELNLLRLGDDMALSRGVPAEPIRMVLLLVTSLCVGAMVAVCGPIGFVGMMVPHMARLIIGQDHRYLVPYSALMGGSFLILCDVIGRTIIAPAEIPVGVITALLGGPFFIWLLMRRVTAIS